MFPFLSTAVEVQPIPPNQIVDAVNAVGKSAADAGSAMAGGLAGIALVFAGIFFLVGVGLAMAHITNKVLKLATGILVGAVLMFILTAHPVEVVGLIRGFFDSFFSHLKGSGASTDSTAMLYFLKV